MKYSTAEIAEHYYTVSHATSRPAGYGHREITATVSNGSLSKTFRSITNDMSGYDEATELEGQDRYEALFNLVESNLSGKIAEWLIEQN